MKKIIYGALGLLLSVTSANAQCFTPFFETGNLVPDPELTNITRFPNSWGSAVITRAESEVYCGTSSGKIPASAQGSFTFLVSWKPNTDYILRALVNTNGTFQIGVGTTYIDNGSKDTDFEVPNTDGEWVSFERTFRTGSSAGSGECWFNNYQKAGTIGYIDNWELYVDNELKTSLERLTFDYTSSEKTFTVSGTKESGTVTVQAPEGVTVSPASFDFLESGQVELTVQIDEELLINGTIVLTNSFKEVSIPVRNTHSTERFVPTELMYENLVPDPHLNDASQFNFTGTAEIHDILDGGIVPYCGASCGKIGDGNNTCSGSIEVPVIAWKPNTTYRVLFMVRGQGSFNLGLTGVDGTSTQRDVNFSGSPLWKKVDYTFKTGPLAVQGSCLISNCEGATGKVGYIDNWEIYEIPDDLCD